VLEVPTCRWSTYECLRLADPPERCAGDEVEPYVQQRAWSSPVWYAP
jgi:hypothetical protein